MAPPATPREAHTKRLTKMMLWMRAKPEKARRWLMRMNHANRGNPKGLKILAALATLRVLTKMALWMRTKPEKARRWLMRMNQTNRGNPKVLEVFAVLATLRGVEVPVFNDSDVPASTGSVTAVP